MPSRIKAAGSAEQLLLTQQEKPQQELLHQELLGGEETAESTKVWKNSSFSSLLLLQPLNLSSSGPHEGFLCRNFLLARCSVLTWCV